MTTATLDRGSTRRSASEDDGTLAWHTATAVLWHGLANRTTTTQMEKALWYLLTATRGGTNRARIIRSLSERPKNANQLAEELDVNYRTITHHIDILEEHNVVEPGGKDYGKLYFLTDQFEQHRDTFESILEAVD